MEGSTGRFIGYQVFRDDSSVLFYRTKVQEPICLFPTLWKKVFEVYINDEDNLSFKEVKGKNFNIRLFTNPASPDINNKEEV